MKSSDRPSSATCRTKVLRRGHRGAVRLRAVRRAGADVIELESTVAPDMYRMYGVHGRSSPTSA